MFRDLRNRQGLSLQALGSAVGVDPSTISRWESRKEFHQFARFVMALHRLGMTPEVFLALQAPPKLEALPPQQPQPQPATDRFANPALTNRLQKWGL
jgi:transcriptional regulator with XRE-family HTH domain